MEKKSLFIITPILNPHLANGPSYETEKPDPLCTFGQTKFVPLGCVALMADQEIRRQLQRRSVRQKCRRVPVISIIFDIYQDR
jgi:hypothetical protein